MNKSEEKGDGADPSSSKGSAEMNNDLNVGGSADDLNTKKTMWAQNGVAQNPKRASLDSDAHGMQNEEIGAMKRRKKNTEAEAVEAGIEVTPHGTAKSRPKLKPPKDPVDCPRCSSSNTKFCYYNNHNIKQPRFYCKTCQRYWTEGGVLRNVPVGAGRRKSKSFL